MFQDEDIGSAGFGGGGGAGVRRSGYSVADAARRGLEAEGAVGCAAYSIS